jgi:hypothetical protein
MQPDGSEPRALTADPLYNHSAFRWGPPRSALAYMRFHVLDPGQPAEIWVMDLGPGDLPDPDTARRLAAGYLPKWLP